MRLSSFVIRNFKAITELRLTIPKTDLERPGSADFLSLVGENNASKSSVLEALKLALPGTDLTKPTIDHFRDRNVGNGPIEIELEFDELTAADQAEQGIRTHVHDGKYRIKKVWGATGVNATIWAYEDERTIPSWPESDNTRTSFENAGSGWSELITAYEEQFGPLPARINNTVRENLKVTAFRLNSELVEVTPANWVQNPGGFSSHVDSVLPKVIFVPAIRETKEEAEVTKTKSSARQIVEVMFTRELADNTAINLYNQAGAAVRQLFEREDGSEIVRNVENRITGKLSRLIDLEVSLDFSPPDITSDLASKTVLEISDGICKTKPEHQGHGAQRALILSLLELLAEDNVPLDNGFMRGIIILFEEPEIYLHPQMCRKMRDVLLSIARSGTAQVLCTTHNPVFLDLADRHDGIAILQKTAEGIRVLQRTDDLFSVEDVRSQRQRLRMILDFDPSVNEIFFTKRVCLVEGECEIASLDAIAKKLSEEGRIDWDKYLLERRDLALVNCSGKWTITAFQRVLNGFFIDYKVVHDSDNEEDSGANHAILDLLGLDEERRLVHNPNFERHIFEEDWTKDKPWKAYRKITSADNVSADLINFFEFVLGKRVEEIA